MPQGGGAGWRRFFCSHRPLLELYCPNLIARETAIVHLPIVQMSEKASKESFVIRQEKSHSFQTFRVEGVILTDTPGGDSCLTFYNERLPLPSKIVYTQNDAGEDDVEVVTDCDILREFCMCAVLDRSALEDLRKSIDEALKETTTPET